jgi:hydroxymethylpyrimidine kinase / phosphomethylpyrimidine kinase / thiamine-phosphate diphosphorylase
VQQSSSFDRQAIKPPARILLIAGSDSAGAAGIQADMATCYGLEMHPVSAITALTAQHSGGVISTNPVSIKVLGDQLKAALKDGYPAAIKIGLVASAEQAELIRALLLNQRGWGQAPVVWDPVMASSSGKQFATNTGWMASLLADIDIITPNIDEAERLSGHFIQSPEDMRTAVNILHSLGPQGVWLKGGHRSFADYPDKQLDLFSWQGKHYWLVQNHLEVKHSRGTGCTLSTALAVFMAQLMGERTGASVGAIYDAVVLASAYVHQGLRQGYGLGGKPGPIAHMGRPMEFTDYPLVVDNMHCLGSAKFPDCGARPLGLYPVVDSLQWMERLLNLGVETIQLRVKDMPETELEATIKQAVNLGHGSACRLFINDYWQLAIKYGAYGVHLGQEDIASADIGAIRASGLRLGISTHSEFEWARAASLHPSYLAIGAIYPTQTKEVKVVGEYNLQRWVSILKGHFPLTAIGGINHQNLNNILDSGIESAAVVSAITKAEDYVEATISLLHAFNRK